VKIAISVTEARADAQVDQRFGRAKSFAVYDTESQEWSFLDNTVQLNAAQGAGIQTAEILAKNGVQAVISGHCGPNAFRTLSAAGIKAYTGAAGSAREALDAFNDGKLTASDSADVQGHWQ
jgi:predicted Fe-Mo cluster-binding NifX family protein